ncbi:DNA double-strand break repair nuclease NurA [Thermomicrobium sp. 4228-Ro]|uniref:DNA double-strand break repair nuclease NurA n=1 Tax=Thermomicrobium sp. 4228-Ro TaxID=2993937 RepID=UPI0022492ACD|nr:DNA double-strand break repair nuclease NurA [Thermomicrobium sp. 4228-Ro]MCX2726054.1 DNA double-strand break repair nuclease NurA [Thermomicrobium sp. 4228-Ro]
MTLDLLKVIDALRQAVVESSVQTRHREPELLDLLATFDDDEVLQRIERAKTSWLLGIALDRYFVKYPAPAIPADGYSCIATDGSIVASDRHGPLAYAVVNIGFCILQYGQTPEAHLGAEPTVLWREEDLWIADGARRIPVSGTVLGLRRAVMELRAGLSWIDRVTAPSVVLLDGTLIPWGLEGQATTVVQWVMREFAPALAAYRMRRVPVAGIISYPGSRDIVNVLRVAACDYPVHGRVVDCDDCLLRVQRGERQQACLVVPNVTDRWLFGEFQTTRLAPGERTGCFRSRSTILQQLPEDDQIVFFYVQTGAEIARVELPFWIARDSSLLDLVHAVVWDQCQRARGYPLALQEAHEQAVIHWQERAQLETLIQQLYAAYGLIMERSAKERSKRVRFA